MNLYRWSVVILLVGLGAGLIEIVLFAIAVNTKVCNGLYCPPNWDLAIAVSRAGILTSLICIVSGVVGARQKRPLGISELGVVVGVLGLWFTLAIEAFQHGSGGLIF